MANPICKSVPLVKELILLCINVTNEVFSYYRCIIEIYLLKPNPFSSMMSPQLLCISRFGKSPLQVQLLLERNSWLLLQGQ